MANTTFMRVEEVAEELGVSKSYEPKSIRWTQKGEKN